MYVRAGLKPIHFVSGEKIELKLDESIERITGIISGDSVRKDFEFNTVLTIEKLTIIGIMVLIGIILTN